MQQQTNFFTPTQKHLIQLHGFTNITDIIYVKPLYSVRSLVVYPSLRPDSVAIPLFPDKFTYVMPSETAVTV